MHKLLDSITKRDVVWIITLLVGVLGAVFGINFPIPPTPEEIIAVLHPESIEGQGVSGGVTNLSGLDVAAPTVVATAIPAAVVDSLGVSNLFEVRDAATPVWAINDGGAVVQTGNTTQTGNLALTGDIALTGGLDLSGLLQTSFTNYTVTDGLTITPTVTTYALDTAGAVTITLAASADEGQLLILINDDANATIIADTNVRTSTGSALTMAGAHDILVFIFQDSEWLELLAIADS